MYLILNQKILKDIKTFRSISYRTILTSVILIISSSAYITYNSKIASSI